MKSTSSSPILSKPRHFVRPGGSSLLCAKRILQKKTKRAFVGIPTCFCQFRPLFKMVFFPSLFSKAKKLSQASDKQKRINELLNASHNSQAERDYLRGQILKIFEEDEKALEDMAKDVPPRQRKPGRSQSIDGVNSRIDEGFDEESDFLNKSQKRSNDNGSNTTSGLGSDDLQSRGSLQFIDVKVSGLEIAC